MENDVANQSLGKLKSWSRWTNGLFQSRVVLDPSISSQIILGYKMLGKTLARDAPGQSI